MRFTNQLILPFMVLMLLSKSISAQPLEYYFQFVIDQDSLANQGDIAAIHITDETDKKTKVFRYNDVGQIISKASNDYGYHLSYKYFDTHAEEHNLGRLNAILQFTPSEKACLARKLDTKKGKQLTGFNPLIDQLPDVPVVLCYTYNSDSIRYTFSATEILGLFSKFEVKNNRLIKKTWVGLEPVIFFYNKQGLEHRIIPGEGFERAQLGDSIFLQKELKGNDVSYRYEYDKQGNWTSQTVVHKDGEQLLKSRRIEYRE